MFRMQGVIPPMITPFHENGEVDHEALKELVNFLCERVDGLFAVGSYGGGTLMEEGERMQLAEEILRLVNGRIPVIIHVGTTNTLSSARLARHAAEQGAAAVSAVGPYYYKHNDDEICAFYEGIKKATAGLAPLYVYNNPRFQGYPMSLALMRRLKEQVGVDGVKDATFDIIEHANYLRTLKDERFDVALGTEAMWLSACVLGCEAFIPGLGNAFPELCQKMYREGRAGDYEACRKTQFCVNELRDIMYCARSTQVAVYAMLELRGIIRSTPRSPFSAATAEEKARMGERLRELGVL